MKAAQLFLKRAYEPPSDTDGTRVLVDRLWPRGLEKHKAAIDVWLKDVAPTTELRKWFGHDPARWTEFRRRYRDELVGNSAVDELHALMKQGRVTLIYAARDQEHNEAVVLRDYLTGSESSA